MLIWSLAVRPRDPLRKIRQGVTEALANLAAGFDARYTDFVCASIPPEPLIHAGLLKIRLAVRPERPWMEQMEHALMSGWGAGLGIDDPVLVPTAFTKNPDRRPGPEMSHKVMPAILAHREVARSRPSCWCSSRLT